MKLSTIIIALFLVALVAAGVFIYLNVSTGDSKPVEYNEEISLEQRDANTALTAALISAGIDESMADVSEEQVYVAYSLPQGYDAEITQRMVLGAAASAGSQSSKLVVVQYENGVAKTVWSVAMADFRAYVREEITGEELDSKIEKITL